MTINQQTFTIPAIAVGVAQYTRWENGKDTEIPEGTKIDILFESGFDRIRVPIKIPVLSVSITQEQVAESKTRRVPILVIFDSLEITPYINKSGALAFSGRASKVKVADSNKKGGFPDTPVAQS
jgi:hypothetical protein